MTENQVFVDSLIHLLRKKGYDCVQCGDGIEISKNGVDIMRLWQNGDYRPHNGAISECITEIQEIHQKAKKVYDQYNEAGQMEYETLNHYRKLLVYNGIILAARMNKDGSLEFATWKESEIGSDEPLGQYFECYEHAKEDFAVRSGLVDRYKMLNETELKLIYQGLVHLGADYPHLTTEQMTNIGKLIEKVEMLVPAIREREVYEHQDLAAEDGLEI